MSESKSRGRQTRPSPKSRTAVQQGDVYPDNYSLRGKPSANARASRGPSGPPVVILLHKPWGLLSQFRDAPPHPGLSRFGLPADVYPAGRLDRDSEGLLVLTNDGGLQARISHPRRKWPKTYAVQVEGEPDPDALRQLAAGVSLKDGPTLPADVTLDPNARFPPRDPPIRERRNIPTHWIRITIREGRNRQVRRMTAHVGLPTLRLIRIGVGPLTLAPLGCGEWRQLSAEDCARLYRWRP